MPIRPIHIKQLTLAFNNQLLLNDQEIQISPRSHIGIIGRNGSGKTTLLKAIAEHVNRTDEQCIYIPQLRSDIAHKSGGEACIEATLSALTQSPDLLLLDEPSNHLDSHNKNKLINALTRFHQTLIIVSHDQTLLTQCTNELWYLNNQAITTFHGSYKDFLYEQKTVAKETFKREQNKSLSQTHQSLMKEQQRAAKSKKKGFKNIHNNKYPTVKSTAKFSRANSTSQTKKQALTNKKKHLQSKIESTFIEKPLQPTFHFQHTHTHGNVIHIESGYAAYTNSTHQKQTILSNINITIRAGEKILLQGRNGSGKSTLLKSILNSSLVERLGTWQTPPIETIAYLEQHYSNLTPELSVIDSLKKTVPSWGYLQLRKHLNDFLFRKNQEVDTLAGQLSGGEKARLSLAIMAAKAPRLLLIDELTNNLDIQTKEHVIEVLKEFPGTMLIICHEDKLIQKIKFDRTIVLEKTLIKDHQSV